MTKFEAAAKLEDEVQATLHAWNIEEIAAMAEAAEQLHEEGIYNTKALNRLAQGGY